MNNYIDRKIVNQIKEWLFYGKIVILYGPRQVGKTTLAKHILKEISGDEKGFISCDRGNVGEVFASKDPEKIKAFLGEGSMFVLDEAQTIPDIGLILKVFYDAYPKIKIIATGSSSFELANRVTEPLTGRAKEITLLSFSWNETKNILQTNRNKNLAFEKFLRFGGYPDVLLAENDSKAIGILETIANSYLYKDIFMHENIRKPELITKILKLLARQMGNEVSYNEIAKELLTNRATIVRYIELLEKTFVIFRLPGLERNRRNEVGSRKTKIYFYDIGIRNAIIQSYGTLENRLDVGALWENFCILERMKEVSFYGQNKLNYFWRTDDGNEIDHIEEYADHFTYFEYKWGINKKENKNSIKIFSESYKNSTGMLVNKENFEEFLKFNL
ncbi:MAG: AAA ATPase [Candidatus Nomurabacteria bacterium GW2011_GWA2_40_9]|uniref:AAA ATPase n=1 Tax=Candidatus Nomurabacteria bacterium GW2011_GWA2_40_9 TaxID=1618734 RepID=A0A0G0TXY7_9BACT|nr:MAG: AAA ATPase [Candidatus Nomurabacteria bacterium GW2011_GWA2_40_9]